jgi:hypothetical protein
LLYICHISVIVEFYLEEDLTCLIFPIAFVFSFKACGPQYYLYRTITTVTEKFKCKVEEKLVRNTCVQIQESPKLKENNQVLKQPTNPKMQKQPDAKTTRCSNKLQTLKNGQVLKQPTNPNETARC